MDTEWTDDYLDALWDALRARRVERVREASRRVMEAKKAKNDATLAENQAMQDYNQAKHHCDIDGWPA